MMQDKLFEIEVLAAQAKNILAMAQDSEIKLNDQMQAVLYVAIDYCNRIELLAGGR